MSDMPERIWVDNFRDTDDGKVFSGGELPLSRGGVEYVLASRLAEVEAERDEALRRRDAWKARAEGHVEIVNALRAKTAGKDSRTLGRALLGAAKMEAEARADALQREVEALVNAAAPFVAPMQNADFSRQLRQHEELVAAIKSARAALETRSEQGEG
jgi:hypothetical protein